MYYQYCCFPVPRTIMNITARLSKPMSITCFGRKRPDVPLSMANCDGFQRHICQIWRWWLLTIIILSVLTPIGIATNTLVLSMIGKIKSFRKATSEYIRYLTVFNLLVILQMILMVILYESDTMSKASFEVQYFLFPTIEMVLGSACMLFVTALAVERTKSVLKLRTPDTQGNDKSDCYRGFIFIYCFVLLIMGLVRIKHSYSVFNDVFFHVTIDFGFALPFLVMVGSYVMIIFSAFKYRNIEIETDNLVTDERKSLTNQMKLGDSGERLKNQGDGSNEHIAFIVDDSALIDQWLKHDSVNSLSKPKEPLVNQEIQDTELTRLTHSQEIKISSQIGAMILPLICGWIYYMSSMAYERISGRYILGLQSWSVLFAPFIVSSLSPLVFMMFTWPMWKCVLSKWCMKFVHICLKGEHAIARI